MASQRYVLMICLLGFHMRLLIRSLVVVMVVLGAVPWLHAQMLPRHLVPSFLFPTRFLPKTLGVDSSLRIEYLLGNQILRSTGAVQEPVGLYRVDFSPRFPVLAGTVEVSPDALVSARFAGALSIMEPQVESSRQISAGEAASTWKASPDYRYWELAGLLHLATGGGYRFSMTAGYRQTTWEYRGELEGVDDSRLKDRFVSYTPFVGLQTAMLFPWWKARFEILGSPFMSKSSSLSLRRNALYVQQDVQSTRGGLVELQSEGTVNLYSGVWVGLYGRYHYQELYGKPSDGADIATEFVTREDYASVGLNVTIIY